MNSDYIHRNVSDDGRLLRIEYFGFPSLTLSRDEAMALLEVLNEQLPKMAVQITQP